MIYQTAFRPEQVHESVWIAPGAVIVGDVTLAQQVSIWYNAVLRGDNDSIYVDEGTNIQDACVLHVDPGFPLRIGKGVTVGHRAIIHGSQVGDYTLIGMGSILLNGCTVGENCMVGAGSLLPQGKVYPAGTLILGSPARVMRDLSDEEIEQNRQRARGYVEKAKQFRQG